MQLHQAREAYASRDTQILVAGPDSREAFRKLWEQEGYGFIGIPDAKASILKLYGQEIQLFRLGRMPAQVLVDRQGIARYVYYGHSMSDIPLDEEVLSAIDGLED